MGGLIRRSFACRVLTRWASASITCTYRNGRRSRAQHTLGMRKELGADPRTTRPQHNGAIVVEKLKQNKTKGVGGKTTWRQIAKTGKTSLSLLVFLFRFFFFLLFYFFKYVHSFRCWFALLFFVRSEGTSARPCWQLSIASHFYDTNYVGWISFESCHPVVSDRAPSLAGLFHRCCTTTTTTTSTTIRTVIADINAESDGSTHAMHQTQYRITRNVIDRQIRNHWILHNAIHNMY